MSASASASASSSSRSSPSPDPPPSRLSRPVAARARASSSTTFTSLHRRHPSTSSTLTSPTSSFLATGLATGLAYATTLRRAFLALPPVQRILVSLLLLVVFSLSITLLVFSHRVFSWLAPIAQGWRDLPAGWLPIWLMVFCTAFPPMIGYSFANTLAGFVFGFPGGWPIVATAAVAGSMAAFVASRTVLSAYVHRLVGRDARFVALGQVLRRDGLFMLTMIRFCPLPFSLSNGFLATIPSITPWGFAMGTALSSPKLLVHVFIGSRLALLAEHGDTMTGHDKAINYLSMILGGVIGITVGVVIYRRTMERAAEIARGDSTSVGSPTPGRPPNVTPDFADIEAGLLDPEDAAALMDDDDMSLWDAPESAYRDDDDGGGENGVAKKPKGRQ